MGESLGLVQRALGALGVLVIRWGLRILGRRVDRSDAPWLDGPIGPSGGIVGDDFYERLAEERGLVIHTNRSGSGLVSDFDVLDGPDFHVASVDPAVRHFYESTHEYDLDVWSETRFPARLFLWLLVSTVSRYMNQLNFPVFGLEMSRGMTSDILDLAPGDGAAELTGWFRKVKATGRVIYTGFYMSTQPPGASSRCVKVVFPLPSGSATVLLRPGLDDEGVFTLTSAGRSFGDPGFYRLLEVAPGKLRVRYLQSLKEHFRVYRDEEDVLRCDHRVEFLGMTMLRLHYRMTPGAR